MDTDDFSEPEHRQRNPDARRITYGKDSVRTFLAPDPNFHEHGSASDMNSTVDPEEEPPGVIIINPDVQIPEIPPSPRFMVKRQVSAHGERILTSLNEVCRKMEVLAVLPQVMSRIALGDMDLETALGEECTAAILQLLYIQMHWIELRNGGGMPFNYMGKTINEIKGRLEKGVHTYATKLKFVGNNIEKDIEHENIIAALLEDEGSIKTHEDEEKNEIQYLNKHHRHGQNVHEMNAEDFSYGETSGEDSYNYSKKSKLKRKTKSKKQYIPTKQELDELEVWKEAELLRTRKDTFHSMKKMMSEAYGTEVSEENKEQIIHDFFYDTIVRESSRKVQEDIEKKKEYLRREKEKQRNTHHHHKYKHYATSVDSDEDADEGENMREDSMMEVGSMKRGIVNPLDEFLSDTERNPFGDSDGSSIFVVKKLKPTELRKESHQIVNLKQEHSPVQSMHGSVKELSRQGSSASSIGSVYDHEKNINELSFHHLPGHNVVNQPIPHGHKITTQGIVLVEDKKITHENGEEAEENQMSEKHLQIFATLLNNPEKTKFLRKLIRMKQRDMNEGVDATCAMTIEKKRLGLVLRAVQGKYGRFVRHALKRNDLQELLFLIKMDKRYRFKQEHGEITDDELNEAEIDARNFEKFKKQYTTGKPENTLKRAVVQVQQPIGTAVTSTNIDGRSDSKWYIDGGYGSDTNNDIETRATSIDENAPVKINTAGWRLVQESSSKAVLIKTWKDIGGEVHSRRIRITADGRPETPTEKKNRRLEKLERRKKRENKILELQNLYGTEIPRIVYEKYEREMETDNEDIENNRGKTHTIYRVSSDDSDSSHEEDEEVMLRVTDPYPFRTKINSVNQSNKKNLPQKHLKNFPKEAYGVDIPENSESYKLGSIRLLTANYNMGRAAAVDMPWIGPELFGIPKDQYMAEQLKSSYREVMRLLSLNEYAISYFEKYLKTHVTYAVKIFYSQIQILQGLMYARLLMTSEEEIKRIQFLKQTWIREQRLHNLYSTLETEFNGLATERDDKMENLNVTINQFIIQIDVAFQQAHHEITRISGDAGKKDLLNSKAFDQDLQQLDGTYQKALKFATSMRFKLNDEETKLKKRRFKMESELEAVIDSFDVEMTARQEILDQLEVDGQTNKTEVARLEKALKKIESRYGKMLEEMRLRELEEELRNKQKKKKKKGKKGKGKKGKKGKKGGKKKKESDAKGKGKKGKDKKGGGKKGGKKHKKGSTESANITTDFESSEEEEEGEIGDDEEEEEMVHPKLESPKKKTKDERRESAKKGKGKTKESKEKGGKGKGKKEKSKDLIVSNAGSHEEEEDHEHENETEHEGSGLISELVVENEEEEGLISEGEEEEESTAAKIGTPESPNKKDKKQKGGTKKESNAGKVTGTGNEGKKSSAKPKPKKK